MPKVGETGKVRQCGVRHECADRELLQSSQAGQVHYLLVQRCLVPTYTYGAHFEAVQPIGRQAGQRREIHPWVGLDVQADEASGGYLDIPTGVWSYGFVAGHT